ncbi:5-amino-6-(D-ribitylamino)uracil--L-tyrosine 4-hydroxyphenyl transferase CofH [Novosphingobium sp. FGD1]|uniref:FO synthase n=1 Tax=Novosphingobium silvae TaxID=2692619 RepID=A0A7X4GEY3_9SPHN|nr:5-amino-6-(D-ribitylamino)uracil--L-tyrosine 4-hydroxyphenyl transferase CofH [Novosphingobium silvae]MYL97009.1 5-amino-6-(D-ribitylamino)uracil--L-tyrosine 4-hydroxyphenyl transferase CofH [Novosphingobium silvae]
MARDDEALITRLLSTPLDDLLAQARAQRAEKAGACASPRMTYSPKVFIPLTRLCADVCHYCTFATTPSRLEAPFLSEDEVIAIARSGVAAGCKEALFTLGDAPERRYAAAREWLAERGFARTIDYVQHCAGRVLRETGLLPHINAGVLEEDDWLMLRTVAASIGLMLESTSERLLEKGMCHHGSPDKAPEVRLASLAAAGRARVPTTSGILVGIGETARERMAALIALRDLHEAHGHIQEVIVQNFCAKPGTRMFEAPEASEADFLRVVAAARIVLPPEVSVQAPPNLNDERLVELIEAGIDDWGGISPVTQDHVNPEAPWPGIARLEATCAASGMALVERLTVYPRFIGNEGWIDPAVRPAVLRMADADGLGRDSMWSPGMAEPAPGTVRIPLGRRYHGAVTGRLNRILDRAANGNGLDEAEVTALFAARGRAAEAVIEAADTLRAQVRGNDVTYVVNRNINYTNICTHACSFCAFSKSSSKAGFRDRAYNLDLAEIARRAREAVSRGATEVCLQGGIHPSYTGETYLSIVRAVKDACPDLHVHAFSPLEVSQGARTLGMTAADYLAMLRDAGLGSLPGTAAEILHDDIRAKICPDKLTTREWIDLVRSAHRVGLPTTSTIMFGHLENPRHWARHLNELRNLQLDTGGITEFVPLPLVHMEAPFYRRGQSRKGPTWRETVMMHAIARLALHGAISSIQVSWVKLGMDGAAAVLAAGANDLGGVLMDESISRAAGASHGQLADVAAMRAAAEGAGRRLRQRTTLYKDAAAEMA